DQIGKAGLEKKFDKVLRGEEGKKIIIIDEFDRETVLAEDEVKHGENVHLTLDVELQQTMFDSFDDKSGTGVALHPTNGDLLALVSYPLMILMTSLMVSLKPSRKHYLMISSNQCSIALMLPLHLGRLLNQSLLSSA